jgi:glucose/arabinose dehydrogenase
MNRLRPKTRLRLVVTTMVLTTAIAAAAAPSAQAAIAVRRVKGGLDNPAAFTFLPGGFIVYLERSTGQVRLLNPTTGGHRLLFDIAGVNGSGERGALGVAVHPQWPAQPFIYAYVTRSSGGALRNQIVRIKVQGGVGVGIRVLLSTPASASPYHNGGRIAFGPGGMLFAIVGDGHTPGNAQDLTRNLRGKMLRIRPDGGIPADNPIIGGRRTHVFAYGIRNSFGFTFDPIGGRLWETENGPACNDEINLVVRRGNYAWGPHESCPNTNRDGPRPRRLPKAKFASPIGITGAAFCDGCGLGFQGDLFFGACCDGGILRRGRLNAARDDFRRIVRVRAVPGNAIYSMESAPDGRIYFSDSTSIYRLVRV